MITAIFYNCTQVQLIASIFLCVLMIIYFYKVKPYKSQLINWMTLFDEVMILLCYVFTFYFSEIYDDKNTEPHQYKTEVGWAAIGVLGMFFIGNLGYLLPVKIAEIYYIIKNKIHSYKDKKKHRKIQNNIRKKKQEIAKRKEVESKINSSLKILKSVPTMDTRKAKNSKKMEEERPKKVIIRKVRNLEQVYLPFNAHRPNGKLAKEVQKANFESIFK